MSNDALTFPRDRLLALIEIWGANPARWPAQEREPASALLAALRAPRSGRGPDREIEAALATATEIDRSLDACDAADSVVTPERQARLAAAVLAAVPSQSIQPRYRQPLRVRPVHMRPVHMRPVHMRPVHERPVHKRLGRTSRPGTPLWHAIAAAGGLLAIGMVAGWSLAAGHFAAGPVANERGFDDPDADRVVEFLALTEEWEAGGELIAASNFSPPSSKPGSEPARGPGYEDDA